MRLVSFSFNQTDVLMHKVWVGRRWEPLFEIRLFASICVQTKKVIINEALYIMYL